MAHLAFERCPSNFTGILRCDTFEPLSLQGVVCDVEVHDTIARVSVTYEYKNSTSSAQEVFSAFNAIPGWTTVSMRSDAGSRWIRTLVGADSLSAASKQPESDQFVASVVTQSVPWSLMVHETMTTTATFYAPLEFKGASEFQLRIPKFLFPRRVDVDETARDYNAKFDVHFPHKLARSVYMNVHGQAFDEFSQPPTITAGTNAVGQCNKHTFSAKWESHAHDLVVGEDLVLEAVTMPSKDPLKISVWKDLGAIKVDSAHSSAIIPSQFTYAGTVALTPTFTVEQLASVNDEIVFVLDNSASMLPVWNDVLQALRLAIASLPPTTHVNLAWYSNEIEYLFPLGSELLSEEVRSYLIDEVLTFRLRTPSTSSSTKLYQAIQALYKQPYITGFVRNFVLITDGGAEPHLAARSIEIARANTHSSRFSTVGVGANASVGYLEMLAKETQGAFRHAVSSSSCATSLAEVIREVHVPTLVQVVARTEYEGNPEETVPVVLCNPKVHLPCVPLGHRILIPYFGAGELKQFSCVVSGMLGLHHVDYRAQSTDLRSLQNQSQTEASKPESSSLQHVAAALSRIERLINGGDHSALTAAEKLEVITLSTAFFVPSPVTTYLSGSFINPQLAASTAVSAVRYVNPRVLRKSQLDRSAKNASTARDATGLRVVNADAQQVAAVQAEQSRLAERSTKAFIQRAVLEEVVRLVSGGASVDDVLLSQHVDGSFHPNCRLFAGIGSDEGRAVSRKPADADDKVWATALACAFLSEAQSARISALSPLPLQRAKGFLKAHQAESLVTTAKRVLSS